LPLHTTPLDERNMVRLWYRLDAPLPRVEWFTGGPLDLLHATDFVLPPSGARRKLLTIHDLAFLFYPDAAMPSLHRYLNVVVPRSVRRADGIIADSRHTAQDLTEQWGVAPDRITVVQGAVDHSRFQPVTDAAQLEAVRRRYGLADRPYILALSRLEPRKNFVRLIEAFAQARSEGKLPHRLVIGGKQGWLYEPIYARVQELGLAEHVHFPGFIADDDLPALYSAAAFFAYPSLYEGFGLPIIEALACGAPVLAGDNSCLPEAGGPGALYVQADDTESIAAGILRLAADRALAAQLAAAGRRHALQFTWERSAEQLLAAYNKVL
jgi:glycosyltransferase involved in cell wall biosynthesis